VLVLGAGIVSLASPLCAQQSQAPLESLASPAGQWIPLTARFVERDHAWTEHGLPEMLEFSGVYLRDRYGSWYRRMKLASRLNLLRVIGGTDSALLYDRPQRTMYTLDFTRGTAQKQVIDVSATPEFALAPISSREFEAYHSQDKFLGMKNLSGLDCVGYALRDERRKNKYVAEMWYAPSLAFLAVGAKSHFKGDQDVTTMLEDIQPGRDPDPQFFTVPVDLRIVK